MEGVPGIIGVTGTAGISGTLGLLGFMIGDFISIYYLVKLGVG